MNSHSGNSQPAIDREEHQQIGGVNGKKVFVMDNAGNQIIQFSSPTITFVPLSYYAQSSLVSGYIYHGFTNPGSNPTTATFLIRRETLNTGEVLFANGSGTFNSTWSSASLASINYG